MPPFLIAYFIFGVLLWVGIKLMIEKDINMGTKIMSMIFVIFPILVIIYTWLKVLIE